MGLLVWSENYHKRNVGKELHIRNDAPPLPLKTAAVRGGQAIWANRAGAYLPEQVGSQMAGKYI